MVFGLTLVRFIAPYLCEVEKLEHRLEGEEGWLYRHCRRGLEVSGIGYFVIDRTAS